VRGDEDRTADESACYVNKAHLRGLSRAKMGAIEVFTCEILLEVVKEGADFFVVAGGNASCCRVIYYQEGR
jgi:hypothetical protein